MVKHIHLAPAGTQDVLAAADSAARAIPPAWPLATSVAVNPFLGQSGESLAWTAARLGRVAGVSVTMPRSWYRDRLLTGAITEADLAAALAAMPAAVLAVLPEELRPVSTTALRVAAERSAPEPVALPTVADLAAEASGIDWPGVIAERIGAWAAGWFDAGQALWAAPRGKGAYASWRAVATRDLTPEILGLSGFAAHVADSPETAHEALARAAARLGLTGETHGTYFHRLLMSLGGWAQLARQRLWEAELADGSDTTLVELLAIRLLWEEALYVRWQARIADRWEETRHAHAEPVTPTADHILDAILQDAAERADQRRLAGLFDTPSTLPAARPMRPAAQAAFCIDVRSEVFRRALEATDPEIETIGFAGFFGLALSHRGFASDVEENRCPVLLTPTLSTTAVCHDHDHHHHGAADDRAARIAARARRAWGRFKLAAVSSFAFVEAMGPVYAGKLLRDALALGSKSAPGTSTWAKPTPRLDPALGLEARTAMAETVLRAMSLTGGFARVVLLVGHGAGVTNNPHAGALHCGACGGHSGEVNARLLAALLNDGAVRAALAPRGIAIPADTLFVGALHDTTADRVTLYDADHPSPSHDGDLTRLRDRLAAAGALARGERALSLPRASGADDMARRGRDWAEIRPEWALAGCTAFVAAPRARSAGRDLGGRAFLHSYDWREDREFRVLELIMTAPVVVASWISLQYYGSTVAPTLFGAGNKLLHNVTGGVGVIEGNGGVLRAGLPWQSVHDGERLVHEPLRLSVVIEAPREAMSEVLRRHSGLRALFDNGWLHLFAMDGDGRLAWRYAGRTRWEAVADGAAAAREALKATA